MKLLLMNCSYVQEITQHITATQAHVIKRGGNT
uniref:Uncharacterized protein n=1 Tax=Anguilla anguilla TaxID=7936 RepID=A0A0E9UHQ3_ANGAN